MKNIVFIIALCINFLAQAQLLVVTVNSKGHVKPLSDELMQKHGKDILKILLKYTWPSCIGHDLTDKEKKELFANKSGAERDFVSKKLKELNKALDVVFIPTTLYELYVIYVYTEHELEHFESDDHDDFEVWVDLLPILNQTKSEVEQKIQDKKLKKISPAEYVKREINEEFGKYNKRIFEPVNIDVSAEINVLMVQQKLVHLLSEFYKINNHNLINFEQAIFQKREQLKNDFFEKFIDLEEKFFEKIGKQETSSEDNTYKFSVDNTNSVDNTDKDDQYEYNIELYKQRENEVQILKKTIDLEYEAFKQNKGLLFRGSTLFDVKNIHQDYKTVIASTLYNVSEPFSLSFGNSLFAGYINDIGACAYNYLVRNSGYVLFINKFDYVDNYCSNLFFISSLATETAIFGEGEAFHSRSKAAIKEKNQKDGYGVRGMLEYYETNLEPNEDIKKYYLKDPFGIVLITRNPYRQAYLFSKYFLENVVLLGHPNENNLTSEEQIGIEILKNQKEIAREYKFQDWFPRWEKMYLQKKEANKQKEKLEKQLPEKKRKQLINFLDIAQLVASKSQANVKPTHTIIHQQHGKTTPPSNQSTIRTLELMKAVSQKPKGIKVKQ